MGNTKTKASLNVVHFNTFEYPYRPAACERIEPEAIIHNKIIIVMYFVVKLCTLNVIYIYIQIDVNVSVVFRWRCGHYGMFVTCKQVNRS